MIKMNKKLFLFFVGIFFLICLFQIASADINSPIVSGNSKTGGISAENSSGNDVNAPQLDTDYISRITAFLLTFCGNGVCENETEDCNTCVADCGCAAGFTCTAGTCIPTVVPPVVPPPSPSAGGAPRGPSGGAILAPPASFTLSTNTIKVTLTPGSITTKKFTITNNLNKPISLSIGEQNLDNLLLLNDKNMNLNAGESKDVSFDIIVREDVPPNLYVGQISVKNGFEEQKILVILEVESKGALFDLTVTIPDESLLMIPGKKLLAETTLINLGALKKADVLVRYQIVDVNGKSILSQDETVAVETKASLIKEILIPENTAGGKYVLYAQAIYEDKTASSTAEFKVVNTLAEKIFIVIILVFIIGGSISFAIYYRRKKKKEEKGVKRMTIADMSRKTK